MIDVEIKKGDPGDLSLLEVNARMMKHEQYTRLVENIRRDGALTSTPFVWHDTSTGKRIVLSGNHRVKAAIDAGLTEIVWLETDQPLTESQRIAIQLSHNAIAGEDDPAILKELYERIDEIDWREYAGLDDATLELLGDLDTVPLAEANLEFQTLSAIFLPEELEEAKKVIDDAAALAGSADVTWLAPYKQYDQVMRAIDIAGKAHDVTNVATSLALVLDAFARHAGDLRDGWLDPDDPDKPKHTGRAPIESIFQTDSIPTKSAVVVEKAVQAAVDRGDIPAEHRWQILETWAAAYLDSGPQTAHGTAA